MDVIRFIFAILGYTAFLGLVILYYLVEWEVVKAGDVTVDKCFRALVVLGLILVICYSH